MHEPRKITIYPPKSRLKVECRIYPTQRAMHKAARHAGGISNDTLAYCECGIGEIPKKHLAIVYFSETHLDPDTVAHEFTHASLSYFARKKCKAIPCTTDRAEKLEEDFCYVLGALVGRFYKKLKRHPW